MKPPKIWLIADTHFNHDAMVRLCGRPQNQTELIIKNWKAAVSENDITIHLGDVIFNRPSELPQIMAQIPGRKNLILGNHDRNNSHWYMNRGFDFACESMVFRGIFYSHRPAQILPEGATLNIHGHLHNTNLHSDIPLHPWNKLFALEYTDYKPVLLEDFLKRV